MALQAGGHRFDSGWLHARAFYEAHGARRVERAISVSPGGVRGRLDGTRGTIPARWPDRVDTPPGITHDFEALPAKGVWTNCCQLAGAADSALLAPRPPGNQRLRSGMLQVAMPADWTARLPTAAAPGSPSPRHSKNVVIRSPRSQPISRLSASGMSRFATAAASSAATRSYVRPRRPAQSSSLTRYSA